MLKHLYDESQIHDALRGSPMLRGGWCLCCDCAAWVGAVQGYAQYLFPYGSIEKPFLKDTCNCGRIYARICMQIVYADLAIPCPNC